MTNNQNIQLTLQHLLNIVMQNFNSHKNQQITNALDTKIHKQRQDKLVLIHKQRQHKYLLRLWEDTHKQYILT